VLAFIFPGKIIAFPDIGEAVSARVLFYGFLKRVSVSFVIGVDGSLLIENRAKVNKVRLG